MVAERGGRRKRRKTPLDQTADAKSYADAAESSAAPPPPPDPALPEDLLYHRERAYAFAAAAEFERRLTIWIADKRIPLDSCIIPVTLLTIFVEASLVARVIWPELASDDEVDAHPDYWSPDDEADAMAVGLTVRRTRSREREAATLPGCQGTTPGGRACPSLRKFGEKFCPSCRRLALERMRRGE